MAVLMANEMTSYIVILLTSRIQYSDKKPVEFGRQPPGAERFHWVQCITICLYGKVGAGEATLRVLPGMGLAW